jgi:uncharacterized membrane protein
MDKSSVGLDSNVAAALSYAMGWVTGAVFLLAERENRFVRFHALQSTITFGALCIAWMVSLSIPLFGWLLAFIVIPPVSVVLWLLLMLKAYQGEQFKLPIAGDIAEQRL